MQKFGNLSKWNDLKSGSVLIFKAGSRRKIKLYVSTPQNTNWFYVNDDGENGQFAFMTSGSDLIEFSASGAVSLRPDQECRYSNSECQIDYFESDEKSFTKITVKRQRNIEVEMAAARAAENVMKRQTVLMDQMQRVHNQTILDMEKKNETNVDNSSGIHVESKDALTEAIVAKKGTELPTSTPEKSSSDVEPSGESDG